MFILFFITLFTFFLSGVAISDAYKDQVKATKYQEKDKPANECSSIDYDFINNEINRQLRRN